MSKNTEENNLDLITTDKKTDELNVNNQGNDNLRPFSKLIIYENLNNLIKNITIRKRCLINTEIKKNIKEV